MGLDVIESGAASQMFRDTELPPHLVRILTEQLLADGRKSQAERDGVPGFVRQDTRDQFGHHVIVNPVDPQPEKWDDRQWSLAMMGTLIGSKGSEISTATYEEIRACLERAHAHDQAERLSLSENLAKIPALPLAMRSAELRRLSALQDDHGRCEQLCNALEFFGVFSPEFPIEELGTTEYSPVVRMLQRRRLLWTRPSRVAAQLSPSLNPEQTEAVQGQIDADDAQHRADKIKEAVKIVRDVTNAVQFSMLVTLGMIAGTGFVLPAFMEGRHVERIEKRRADEKQHMQVRDNATVPHADTFDVDQEADSLTTSH